MGLIDLHQMIELMSVEPGHGFVQCVLLFMIWLNSRGLKKEVITLGERLSDMRANHEIRLDKIERQLTLLENHGGN